MKKLCILIAEDNEDQRELFTLMLIMGGFEVRSVTNGKEALAELQRSLPDVILTDISMPEMNGLELVRSVKSQKAFAEVPIVVMSAFDRSYLKWAATMGANATISKPFEQDDLFTTILKVLPESLGH